MQLVCHTRFPRESWSVRPENWAIFGVWWGWPRRRRKTRKLWARAHRADLTEKLSRALNL